jgi:hypothetical protein
MSLKMVLFVVGVLSDIKSGLAIVRNDNATASPVVPDNICILPSDLGYTGKGFNNQVLTTRF